mmetsp:Transcript_26177/g.26054  ORF Transcript_26177/g.26054 Transcript_26177/m.26054 type:complete len:103 (+) Transcript_26177:850-1158(+)
MASPVKLGNEIVESIYSQAFPGMMMSGAFALKYSYPLQNYSVPEDEAEQSAYEEVSLSNRERLSPFMNKFDLPQNGWDVYHSGTEFGRQGVTTKNEAFRRIQ